MDLINLDHSDLNVIFLVDDYSRQKLHLNVSELVLYNAKIIHSLNQIDEEMANQYKMVIILEDYLKYSNAISELRLCKAIYNLEFKYISSNTTYNTYMSRFCKYYPIDIALLDDKILYGVVYDDDAVLDKCMNINPNVDKINKLCRSVISSNTYSDDIREMANYCLSLNDIIKQNNTCITELLNVKDDIDLQLSNQRKLNKRILESYKNMFMRADDLKKNLLQYESILTKDVYGKISLQSYKSRPFIIYLKQYEELIHFESFLNTLMDSIKIQLRLSCKILKLFDSSASRKLLTQPQHYKILRNEYTNTDIFGNDYLVKYGQYKNVIDLLLTNKTGLDILIIVDCKDHNDSILIGQDLSFNLCRNANHMEIFGLSPNNTIVNNASTLPLSLDTQFRFGSNIDRNELFLLLSNTPVIKEILQAITVKMEVL